jgi:PhnB protein
MGIRNLNPYIHFNGTAEAAIRLYESALGARVEALMRYSEGPCVNPTEDQKNLILHSLLHIGDGIQFMVSDTTPDRAVQTANGAVQICLDFTDLDSMTRAYDALSANGGQAILPIQDSFWGAKFGILHDPFGICWMFNCVESPN